MPSDPCITELYALDVCVKAGVEVLVVAFRDKGLVICCNLYYLSNLKFNCFAKIFNYIFI